MTTPARNDIEGLPVAEGLWVSEENAAAPALRAELLGGAEPESSYGKNEYHDDKGKAGPGGFTLTTEQGNSQTYWGRFNDPTAQVVPDVGGDGGIPVATARPDDRQIRINFIRKVYTILSAQLLTTFAVCALMALNASVRTFTLGSAMGSALMWINMIVLFVTICFLHAYKRVYPHNYIILSIFTLAMSYTVGFITAAYEAAGAGDLVVEAIFITATVFIVLTLFTLQSKWDFSFMGAALGMTLWIMVLWGFFALIFGFQTGSVYALLGSILFSLYIIYDTYMIAERLDPEDYIVAAIELYLDLINLFLYILRLLSNSRR